MENSGLMSSRALLSSPAAYVLGWLAGASGVERSGREWGPLAGGGCLSGFQLPTLFDHICCYFLFPQIALTKKNSFKKITLQNY